MRRRTGYLISAAVICIDYFYHSVSNRLQQRKLMTSFVIKSSFVIIELAFILAFRITARTNDAQKNTAAILEWSMFTIIVTCRVTNPGTVIAFIFTGYILSFIIDLLPSTYQHSHAFHKYQQLEMDMSSSRLLI